MGIIRAGRTEIAYETSGSGEAGVVMLIRGQGTQLIHWPESFCEEFSTRGFRTIRFDNRDTGLSGKFDHIAGQELEALKWRIAAGEEIDPPYTMDDMVLDVVAIMDGLDIETAHIVGISMGGFIAQLLAAKYPYRVLSMTSIMSGSGIVDPTLIDTLWSVRRSRKAFIQEWVEYVRQFGSKKYFEGDDYSRRIAAAAFDRCYSPDGANRQLLAVFSMKNTRDRVKTISVPTLVVHGAGDLLIPPARGKETADLIPGATFKLIDGMGHDIPPGLGNADFPYVVSEYFFIIFPSKDGRCDWKSGTATGSYKLTKFEPGVRYVGERNPDYWKEGRAHFDRVEQVPLSDQAARTTALITSEVDCIGAVDLSTVHLLKRKPGITVNAVTGTQHFTMPMFTDVAPFDDVNVRLALKYAIDREQLVKILLSGFGQVGNGGTIIPVYAQYVFASRSGVAHGPLSANRDVDGWKSMERWWFKS